MTDTCEFNFWELHSLLFLFFMLFFPRLTLLFATAWGGFWWWMGLIFAPRFMAALIGTILFWDTNPVLVIISWFFALGGTHTEVKCTEQVVSR
jgi:hypothetical protein